jgi:hypothetical protein
MGVLLHSIIFQKTEWQQKTIETKDVVVVNRRLLQQRQYEREMYVVVREQERKRFRSHHATDLGWGSGP